MQKYNLLSVVVKNKYHNYRNVLYNHPNLLNRDFEADRTKSKMGYGYFIYLRHARNTLFINNQRFV